MTSVVIDASAGAGMVGDTAEVGWIAGLVPAGAEGWVPEHFYAEVLAVVRRSLIVEKTINESAASTSVRRLKSWHLRTASVAPLIDAAWAYRHNMTIADALYVGLAEQLGADFLTDDHNLADGPTFPRSVTVLRLATRP